MFREIILPIVPTVRESNLGRSVIFRTCPDRPWGPPSLLYNGYRAFPGVKSGQVVTLTPHSLLMPWSRKDRAIPLLPLWAVGPVQSLSACTRVHFTSVPVQGCTLPYLSACTRVHFTFTCIISVHASFNYVFPTIRLAVTIELAVMSFTL